MLHETCILYFCFKLGRLVDIPAGIFPSRKTFPKQMLNMSNNCKTYTNAVFFKDAHRDLMGFVPSFLHRAPFWIRFVKNMFRTILYYSVLFRTVPYYSNPIHSIPFQPIPCLVMSFLPFHSIHFNWIQRYRLFSRGYPRYLVHISCELDWIGIGRNSMEWYGTALSRNRSIRELYVRNRGQTSSTFGARLFGTISCIVCLTRFEVFSICFCF